VLTVNGTPVTQAEVDRIARLMLSSFPDKHKSTPEMERKAREAARDKLVEMALLHEAARRDPPADLERRVAERLAERRARYQSQKAWENALAVTGMSERELEGFTRKEALIAAFVDREFRGKGVVSDVDVRAFYEKNRDSFKTMEESRRVSHVLVGLDFTRSTPEKKAAARTKAEGLRARIATGEPLAEVARRESTCASARQGGDLNWIQRGQMVPAFERVVFEMKKGEISPVLQTPLGYHVIQLTDVRQVEYASFEESSGKIREYLSAQATRKAVDAYLAKEKAKATIVAAATDP
jgi:parvulin-like peptidyl-prolyl isomerase